MTLQEARQNIGHKVVYRITPGAAPEEGVIASVNDQFVFVRYGSDTGSKATYPRDLELMSR